jgi:hypothetical protein
MTRRWLAIPFVLALLIPSAAQAAPFTLGVCANATCLDLTDLIVTNGDVSTWDISASVGDGNIRLQGVADADPFITFGTTTTNLIAGPVTYAFLFATAIVPDFYNVATSTGGVSVTNGVSGTATVALSAVYPTFISGYGTLGAVPTNLGVDLGTTPCIASGIPFTVTATCPQGTATNTFPLTFYDNLEALLTYTQNDIGSVVSWSGAVTLNVQDQRVVPEPATLALLGGGLMGIASVYRRRRNR